MAKIIKTTVGIRRQLVEQFNVSITCVKNALAFKTFSPRADQIRAAALAAGGQEMEPSFSPLCTTEYTNTEIIQKFSNGAILRLNKIDSSATIVCDNELIGTWEKVTLSVWDQLTRKAARL